MNPKAPMITEADIRLEDEKAVLLYPNRSDFPEQPLPSRGTSRTKLILMGIDLVAIVGALFAATWLAQKVNPNDPTTFRQYALLVTCSIPAWILALHQQQLYLVRYLSRGIDEAARVIRAVAIAILLTGGLSIVLKVSVGRQWVIFATAFAGVLLLVERMVARLMFARARKNGKMMRSVVIAGRNAEGRLVREMLDDDPTLGYRVEGFVEDLMGAEPGESPLAVLGNPMKVVQAAKQTGAAGVIIAATALDIGTSNRLIRSLTEHGLHVELSSTLCDIAANRLTIRPLGRMPMLYVEPVQRVGWRHHAKRAFDLAVGGLVMVGTAPIMLAAALAIKITSPGPIFFRQERVGRDGKEFHIVKLRTMVIDAEEKLTEIMHLNEANGHLFKVKDDPRITKVGKLLRKTSIDELPQLINVMRGEMSLVGPRPALKREVHGWEESLHNRLRVQPGITGMWQVNGRDGDDHDSTYAQLDLYYVDNWSLVTDLAIMARTVPVVLARKGQF